MNAKRQKEHTRLWTIMSNKKALRRLMLILKKTAACNTRAFQLWTEIHAPEVSI